MTNIIVSPDCGNSPKNLFIKDLLIDIANRDIERVSSKLNRTVRWEIFRSEIILGKDKVLDEIQALQKFPLSEMTIKHIITHGRAGAAECQVSMPDGQTAAFCSIFEFSSAKGNQVQAITIYLARNS